MAEVFSLTRAAALRRAAALIDDPAELKMVLLLVADRLDHGEDVPPKVIAELNHEIELRLPAGGCCIGF